MKLGVSRGSITDGRTVNVMFEIHLLNDNFSEVTKFILTSTCLLRLTAGSRSISKRIRKRDPTMRLGSEHLIFPEPFYYDNYYYDHGYG